MALFGALGSIAGGLLGGPAGAQIGAALGGAFGGAQAQQGVQPQQAQFSPFNVSAGFGTGTFANGQASAQLSPELAGLAQQQIGLAGGLFGQVGGINAQDIFQGNQALIGQQFQETFQPLIGTQLSKGLFGSTAGQGQFSDLASAFAQSTLQNQLSSQQQAQALRGGLISQGQGLLSGALGLQSAPLDLLRLGGTLGGQQAGAGANVAQLQQRQANVQTGLATGFGSGLAGAFGSSPSVGGLFGAGGLFGSQSQPESTILQRPGGRFGRI